MGNKHHTLTVKEIDTYEIDNRIRHQIDRFLEENPKMAPSDVRILDWGCGRGRAVLTLLEDGFSAYGVDIDKKVMKKGYPLFDNAGYNPEKHLLPVSDLNDFPDGYFHLIFSEQVFEHVANVERVIKIQSRLLAKDGIGCHVFPAAKMVEESHLDMPFVHWLPKNKLRKLWISFMMLLSKKPETQWPETEGASFREEVNVYYNYLNNSTFYRDNRKLKRLFNRYGPQATFLIPATDSFTRKFIPDFLLQNGFPDQQVFFIVSKN